MNIKEENNNTPTEETIIRRYFYVPAPISQVKLLALVSGGDNLYF